jgi:hypothetical protein
VWDRLFGTFVPETEAVVYGLTKNINTFHLVKIAFHEYVDIAHDVWRAKTWRERWHRAFGHPGWPNQNRLH